MAGDGNRWRNSQIRFVEEAFAVVQGLHWVWYYYGVELLRGSANEPEWRTIVLIAFGAGLLVAVLSLYFGRERVVRHPIVKGLLVSLLVGPGVFAMGGVGFAPFPLMLYGALASLDIWNIGLNVVLLAANTLVVAVLFSVGSRISKR